MNEPPGGPRPGWVPPPGPEPVPPLAGPGPGAIPAWQVPAPGWGPTGPWQEPWSPPPKPKKRFGWGGLIGAFVLGGATAVVGGFFLLVVLAVAFGDDIESGFSDATTHTYISSEADVPDVGECLSHGPENVVVTSRTSVVDCDRSHGSEVAAVVDAPGQKVRPADADLEAFGEDACLLAFEEYVGSDYDESDLDYQVLIPDHVAWNRGDRSVWCLVDTTGGFGLDGTVRNSYR